MKNFMKQFPTASLFVLYNTVVTTLLFVLYVVQHGHP